MITDYQVTVARSILSFSRADTATQAQLLDSYRSIIQEYEDDQNLDFCGAWGDALAALHNYDKGNT